MNFLGIYWVGIDAANIRRLLLSAAFIVVIVIARIVLRGLVGLVLRKTDHASLQAKFWTRQAISLIGALVLIIGLLSIWFADPSKLAGVLGVMSAGLAFALQQPVTSIASYFVILRGNTFTVGDRISMGGVRGDVMQLGFIQTTIMEMGQPPSVQGAEPAMWVHSRQFTGRIVTVSNAKIFAEPVFNYTREFPFLWEEMAIPITYLADRAKAEEILLAAARAQAIDADTMAVDAKAKLQERFGIEPIDLVPRVYYRITDNWLELTVRFLVNTHGIRGIKDAMSRYIISEFDQVGIGIASSTYDIVGLPPIAMRPASPSPLDDRTS